MLLNLSKEEIQRLHKLSQDKNTIEALKKFFLNQFIKGEPTPLAFHTLEDTFTYLASLNPEENISSNKNNLV